MLYSQIIFGLAAMVLFSYPSSAQTTTGPPLASPPLVPPLTPAHPDIPAHHDSPTHLNMSTHLDTPAHLDPSGHPPLVLVGLGASAVRALRGHEQEVVVLDGREEDRVDGDAAPLPCSPSPAPVLVGVGQTVSLRGSLGTLPRPCRWLFQLQDGHNNLANVDDSYQSNVTMFSHEGEGNTVYSNDTNKGYSNDTNKGYSNHTNEGYSNHTDEGSSNNTNNEYSNPTNEGYSNLTSDTSLEQTIPGGFLELFCGELILVGEEEIDVEPDDYEEEGEWIETGGVAGSGDALQQFDEVKCKRGNYLVLGDGETRRERVCGYLQDFTWRSWTRVLRVRLRARRAGGGMGDFEMGGCYIRGGGLMHTFL